MYYGTNYHTALSLYIPHYHTDLRCTALHSLWSLLEPLIEEEPGENEGSEGPAANIITFSKNAHQRLSYITNCEIQKISESDVLFPSWG